MLPIVSIQGPTAVGKSAIALDIIQQFGSELISADSRQVYKKMDIGTAKPSQEEQQLLPHHLLDIVNPNEVYDAGQFVIDARAIAEQLFENGKVPFLVGGTGFYIHSFSEGLFQCPEIDIAIRNMLRLRQKKEGNKKLYQELMAIAPSESKRIHPNDAQRMLRSLEVYHSTGKSLPEHWKEQRQKNNVKAFHILILEDRNNLYNKINKRFDLMMKTGLLSEIEALLKAGYKADDPGMKTVGYQEFIPYFEKQEKVAYCIEKAKQHSRNYAKRQLTWYRKRSFDLVLNKNEINFSQIYDAIQNFIEISKQYERRNEWL